MAALLLKVPCFTFDIDLENQTNQPHGQQDAADPEWIGDGIAHPHDTHLTRLSSQLTQYLLTSPQGGGIGHGTRVGAENDRQRDTEQFVD